MSKGVKISLIVLASMLGLAVLAAGAFIAFRGVGKSEVISLNDYMDVEFSGKDGKGKASMELDTDALKEEYPRVDIDGLLDDCVDGEFDEAKGLSNGDKVTWEWDCDDDKAAKNYHVTLEYEDDTFKVKGLKEDEEPDGQDYPVMPDEPDVPDEPSPSVSDDSAEGISDIDDFTVEDIMKWGEALLEEHFEDDFSEYELVLGVEYVGINFAGGTDDSMYENIVQPIYKVEVVDDMDRNGSFEDKGDVTIEYYTYIDIYNVPSGKTSYDDISALEWRFTGSIYRPNESFYYWGTETLEELMEYIVYYYGDDYIMGEGDMDEIDTI